MYTKLNIEIFIDIDPKAKDAIVSDIDDAINDCIAQYVAYGKIQDGFELIINT